MRPITPATLITRIQPGTDITAIVFTMLTIAPPSKENTGPISTGGVLTTNALNMKTIGTEDGVLEEVTMEDVITAAEDMIVAMGNMITTTAITDIN